MRPGCSRGKNTPLSSQAEPGKLPNPISYWEQWEHGRNPAAWLVLCRMQFGQEQGCICSLIFFPLSWTELLGIFHFPFFFFFKFNFIIIFVVVVWAQGRGRL